MILKKKKKLERKEENSIEKGRKDGSCRAPGLDGMGVGRKASRVGSTAGESTAGESTAGKSERSGDC